MNSIDYKQKYLKYKNKYLELKTQKKLDNQSGGFMYAPGNYVFFIPFNRANFDDDDELNFFEKDGSIRLNDLTNYLGNCTRFLRVRTIGDNLNTDNKLYTNQSSSNVIVRETNDIKDKTVEATQPYVNYVAESTQNLANNISNIATDKYNSIMNTFKKQNGGESCNTLPSEILSNDLLLKSDNDVNEKNLQKIVQFIVSKKLQGDDVNNKITRIIYVKKPIIPGKPTIMDNLRDFTVTYDDDNNNVNVVPRVLHEQKKDIRGDKLNSDKLFMMNNRA